MMQPQQQQQQQGGMVVGIHRPGDASAQALLLQAQQQQQQQQQQHQLMEEGNMGMPEDEDEDEEEEDDPSELAAAVQSSAPGGAGGGGGGGGGGTGGGGGGGVERGPGVVDVSNAMVEQSGSLVAGMMGGHVVEATRRQQHQQHQQQQQRGRSLSGGSGSQSPGGLQMPVLPVPCCRVDGCGEDLSTAGDYHRRHKVCKMHATSPKVINHGQEQRFCQQCSRFHSLAEFDEGKRSCRKRLAGHNERRRRHQPDALALTSGESSPLSQGRETSKKPRGRGAGGNGAAAGAATGGSSASARRGRSALGFGTRAGVSEEAVLQEMQSLSKRARTMKSGDEYNSMFSDAFPERRGESMKGKERAMRLQVAEMMDKRVGEYREIDELDIDIADAEQVKEGLDLGEGVIVPPLPYKRDGKLSLLRSPQEGGVINPTDLQIDVLRRPKEELDKRAWQRDEKETLIHCFWDCPKVQPVWRWAARQLTKLKGSKVRLEMQHAVFGVKVESLTTSDITSVWKLLRGIVVWQIWIARKGKVSSGTQWTSNKVIRASWLDLMMYAYQDWLEVSKKKEAGKADDALELRTKFDNKWLVNQFAGKRAEWIIVWKEADDVLLD